MKLNTLASSAEVKNEWSCTSSPSVCLHGMYRDKFDFYLYNPTPFIKGVKVGLFLKGIM